LNLSVVSDLRGQLSGRAEKDLAITQRRYRRRVANGDVALEQITSASNADREPPLFKAIGYCSPFLRGRNVCRFANGVVLRYRSRQGLNVSISVDDPAIASILENWGNEAGPDGELVPREIRVLLRNMLGGAFRMDDFRLVRANRIARVEVRNAAAPKNKTQYKEAVSQVAQSVGERIGITADLAIRSYIDPKVFWKWTKRFVGEDAWVSGPDGELERLYPSPRFTRKEYEEMRRESLRKMNEREHRYDAEAAKRSRRQR